LRDRKLQFEAPASIELPQVLRGKNGILGRILEVASR
jgi:hypothetical protein